MWAVLTHTRVAAISVQPPHGASFVRATKRQPWHRAFFVLARAVVSFAINTRVPCIAVAGVIVDAVGASATVTTRLACAVVDVGLAVISCEPSNAIARVRVVAVDAIAMLRASLISALVVCVCFAIDTLEPAVTIARVRAFAGNAGASI